MGTVNNGALATYVTPDDAMLYEIPSKWSLEEAATVPVVYSTTLYAMITVSF